MKISASQSPQNARTGGHLLEPFAGEHEPQEGQVPEDEEAGDQREIAAQQFVRGGLQPAAHVDGAEPIDRYPRDPEDRPERHDDGFGPVQHQQLEGVPTPIQGPVKRDQIGDEANQDGDGAGRADHLWGTVWEPADSCELF
jgi:hypothetical protein